MTAFVSDKRPGLIILGLDYHSYENIQYKTLKGGVVQYDTTPSLAKLDDGLDESPTVMVGDKTITTTNKLGKNRGILKPSWAFVKTNTKR